MFRLARNNPYVLPMATVAALALLFVSEGSYWQSLETLRELHAIQLWGAQAERLERTLTAAEVHQRSFLMTGQAQDLAPYTDARTASLDALNQLSLADPLHSLPRLAELQALTRSRLQDLDRLIAERQASPASPGPSPAPDADRQGAADMARMREVIRKLQTEQSAQRDRTNRELADTLLLNRLGVAALSAVLLLALVLYLRKSDALARTLASQQRLVQAEHDRLEIEVAQRTAELTDLTRHLLTAREDERSRLARNLHDDLGSLLTAAKLDAARIRSRLGPDMPEAGARLADLVDKLNSGIALGRAIIEDLRPSTLSHLGLASTLTILLREFESRSGVQVHADLQPVRLSPSAELVAFRVVQEAVTNLSKYAGARQVWLSMGPAPTRPGWVAVSVRDDGKGFDLQAPARSSYGLLGMRYRVEAEGGSLHLQSQPGQGTLVSVWLPGLPPDGGPDTALCPTAPGASA